MRRIILMFIGLFFYVSYASASDAQNNLRTLFTSPSERDQLDKQRSQGKFNGQQSTTAVTTTHKPITVDMQGVVIRHNHKPIVFINNHHNLKSNKVDKGITVNPISSTQKNYIVPIRVNQNNVKLKPGQQWNESDKTVKDQYQVNPVKKKNDSEINNTFFKNSRPASIQ